MKIRSPKFVCKLQNIYPNVCFKLGKEISINSSYFIQRVAAALRYKITVLNMY